MDVLLHGEQATEVYAQANTVLDDADSPDVETAGSGHRPLPQRRRRHHRLQLEPPPAHPTWGGLTLTCVGEAAIVEFDAFPRLLGGFDTLSGRGRWEPGGSDLDAAMLDEFLDAARTGGAPAPTARRACAPCASSWPPTSRCAPDSRSHCGMPLARPAAELPADGRRRQAGRKRLLALAVIGFPLHGRGSR